MSQNEEKNLLIESDLEMSQLKELVDNHESYHELLKLYFICSRE